MTLAKVNGVNISYTVSGRGEPLVMIMGFSARQDAWTSQVPFFKKYYQVITFDNRGVGRSDKPNGPYTTRMLAEDTIGLMDHLNIEKAHIMGASMGGMIAQELAINYPQRVNKLVLACTYACKDYTGGDIQEQTEALKLPPHKIAQSMVGLSLNNPFYRFAFGWLAKIQFRFMSESGKVGLKGQIEACNSHNTLSRLPLIKAPTLVIVGTKDRIIKPDSSEMIASQIPIASLVKIEGGSHSFCLEMKKAFNKEVLNFLKNE